jgi:hypothetical protein
VRRSLYVRTLIAFALVALISYGMAIGSRAAWRWANDRITPAEPSVESMTLQAQSALDKGGRQGLVNWIVQTSERYPNVEIDAVDANGQEILRRFFPPVLRRYPTGEMPLHHGPGSGPATSAAAPSRTGGWPSSIRTGRRRGWTRTSCGSCWRRA